MEDKEAQPLANPAFYLNYIYHLQPHMPEANEGAVSFAEVFEQHALGVRPHTVLLSNYMVDLGWLLEEFPALAEVPDLIVLTGDAAHLADPRVALARGHHPIPVQAHSPKLPLQWGTHHTKMALILSEVACRVVVHSANYVYCDVHSKNQGLFVQDFPSLPGGSRGAAQPPEECDVFGEDFREYLCRYLRETGGFETEKLVRYDFSTAAVALVGSVPGYHKGREIDFWGYRRLSVLLRTLAEPPPAGGGGGALFAQFSSLGSLQEPWLRSFAAALSASSVAGCGGEAAPLPLHCVVPTTGQVRDSLEGWAAGGSIPIRVANADRPFLRPHFRCWGLCAGHRRAGRSAEAMPHIKTYGRYALSAGGGAKLAWFYCGSHNLSKAAWGELQKGGTQFCVRSYELGVLHVPCRLQQLQRDGSRGPGFFWSRRRGIEGSGRQPLGAFAPELISPEACRFPTALPPLEVPAMEQVWAVDRPHYPGLDRHGARGPGGVGARHYGNSPNSPDPPSAAEEARQARLGFPRAIRSPLAAAVASRSSEWGSAGAPSRAAKRPKVVHAVIELSDDE